MNGAVTDVWRNPMPLHRDPPVRRQRQLNRQPLREFRVLAVISSVKTVADVSVSQFLLLITKFNILLIDFISDVNECTASTGSPCRGNQQCENTVGSYVCRCAVGYRFNANSQFCEGNSKFQFKTARSLGFHIDAICFCCMKRYKRMFTGLSRLLEHAEVRQHDRQLHLLQID